MIKNFRNYKIFINRYIHSINLFSNIFRLKNYKVGKLNILSKSTAAHSTLSIDNQSSCKFKKNVNGNFYLASKLNIIKKKISCDNRYWEVEGVHDGYLKKYGILHLRKIKFDLLNNPVSIIYWRALLLSNYETNNIFDYYFAY